jgi:competence protein ComEC
MDRGHGEGAPAAPQIDEVEGLAIEGRHTAWRGFALLAGSVAGAAVQLQQPALWGWPVYAAVVLAGLLATALPVRRQGRIGLVVLGVVGGLALGFGATGGRALAYLADALDPVLEGQDIHVVGVVAQMPQRNESGVRFRFDVDEVRQPAGTSAGLPPRLPPRLALGWYAADTGAWSRGAYEGAAARTVVLPQVHAGQRWAFTVRLKAPHGNLNPHGFDYELWLWEQGMQATGYVRTGAGDAAPELLGRGWSHPVERAREAVREGIDAQVADRRLAGVIAALVTGDQASIERADWDIFRATGVAHLMSISGLHVTMFAWLAAAVVGWLWRRSPRLLLRWPAPHAALVGGVGLAALYALFSGWGVPSQRTVWMLALAALLRLSARRWPWPFAWLAVCAGVVALDPWALMQAGFWLSFVAVGVLFATDSGAPRAGRTGTAARLCSKIWHLLREQFIVTLALAPLSLLLFQQLSLVGLLANAVAIPWVTLVVTPLAMLGILCPPLWQAAAWAVQALGWGLQALAALPGATVSTPAPALWAAIAGVAGGLLIAMRLPLPMRLLGLPLIAPVLLWPPTRPPVGEFELLAADIGQGNAVIVRTATHSLLYDAGPRYSLESDAGHRVLVPLLRAEGVTLDTVVLSHRDSDHTGGAAAVLVMQPQATLLSSIEAGHPLQALRPAVRCEAGQHWDWDGVRFEVLHPVAADYATAAKPNALSCVLRIGHAGAWALLAGDIEKAQETALLARSGDALHADLLLAPHHGSKTSSSPGFLDAVMPRVVAVQSGWRNRFGHPASEVVERYRERGIQVVDSPHCGALRWRSQAPRAIVCERAVSSRYWHHRPAPLP